MNNPKIVLKYNTNGLKNSNLIFLSREKKEDIIKKIYANNLPTYLVGLPL